MPARPPRRAALVLVAIATLGLAACDGDGDGALSDVTLPGGGGSGGTEAPAPTDAPAPEPTDAPAPEPTDAPAPEPTEAPAPEPTASPDDGTTDDGDNSELWLVLLGILAVGAIFAVILASRRSSADATPYSTTTVDRRTELIATAAWIHDQLTLEILAMPPAEAQQRWFVERSRIDQLAIDGRTMAASGYREMWDQLAIILGQLTTSIDTALRVGTMQGADPNLVAEAVNNAHGRRAELGAWVATARSFG
ncbi:MAG: hypothetical protein R2705_21010 [Ilumatobacteraceae bacterium]|nr:hypothetical protein [Ilumatobacter sp.]